MNAAGKLLGKIASVSILSARLAAAAIAGETLDRIEGTIVLKVATNSDWAVQAFLNDQNEMDGFDVDVAFE